VRESPEFLRAILDSIQDGVYFVDRERRITFWNSGAEELTGYPRHEVVGRPCPESLLRHCTPDGVELCETACPLQAALGDGHPREAFVTLRHRSGHRVPVRVRATAVRDAGGVIVGAAEVFEEHGFPPAGARQARTLESLHLVDTLTGLANHEMISTKLAERVAQLVRCGIPFGVLLIDIDQLQHINRNFGRDAGDGILRMAAHTLAKGVVAQHLLGRWDEDQFLAIVDNCDADMLASTAERLCAMVGKSSIEWWGRPVRVTVSIAGVVARAEDDEATIPARAAALLPATQQAGGNAFRVE
jgi:diguanylate cyclase (GGDEF)-like protein/PAS domain S-box-containing protein